MSRPNKRAKQDTSGLALPAQANNNGPYGYPAQAYPQARGSQSAVGGLALPTPGAAYRGHPYPQQPQDASIDPALQTPAPYPPNPQTALSLPSSASQPSASQQYSVQAQPQGYYSATPYTAQQHQQYQQYYAQQAQQQQAQGYQQGYQQPPQPYQPWTQQQQQPSQQRLRQQPKQTSQQQQARQQAPPQQQQPQHQPPQSQLKAAARKPPPQKVEDDTFVNDVLANAGVDLRAEEDAINRSYDTGPGAYNLQASRGVDRSRKQGFMHERDVRRTMATAIYAHNITKLPDDTTAYVALAAQLHLQTILKGALKACKNRQPKASGYERPPSLYKPSPSDAAAGGAPEEPLPMWAQEITRDVGKQIAALERVQRDNELQHRQKKREREEAAANNSVGGRGDGDDAPKKKRKKEGPGVQAKNMSDELRKKLSDQVAARAVGGSMNKYSWMTAAAAAGPIIPIKPRVEKPKEPAPAATTSAPAKKTTGWGRAYANVKEQEQKDTRRRVEVRDVIWAMEGRGGSGVDSGGTKGVGKTGKGGTKWRGWEAWSRVRD